MSNLLFVPFAYNYAMNSGVNVTEDKNERLRIYLKNLAVSLVSAKHYNPDDVVALVTNLDMSAVPCELRSILSNNDISIIQRPFDRFAVPNDYPWALAFYKLCAFSYMLEEDYDAYCYVDADTYVQASLGPLWEEAKYSILIPDASHGLHIKDYQRFIKEVTDFNAGADEKTSVYPTHYSGGLVAASKDNGRSFMRICNRIYQELMDSQFVTATGDEFIVSMAADAMDALIKNAEPYIGVYWTDFRFYRVATSYRYDPVCVLHLPNEKSRGLCKLYDWYISRGEVPSRKLVWSICRISRQPLADRLKAALYRYKIEKSEADAPSDEADTE